MMIILFPDFSEVLLHVYAIVNVLTHVVDKCEVNCWSPVLWYYCVLNS